MCNLASSDSRVQLPFPHFPRMSSVSSDSRVQLSFPHFPRMSSVSSDSRVQLSSPHFPRISCYIDLSTLSFLSVYTEVTNACRLCYLYIQTFKGFAPNVRGDIQPYMTII